MYKIAVILDGLFNIWFFGSIILSIIFIVMGMIKIEINMDGKLKLSDVIVIAFKTLDVLFFGWWEVMKSLFHGGDKDKEMFK